MTRSAVPLPAHVALLTLALLGACRPSDPPDAGEVAREITLTMLDGTQQPLAGLRGRPVVLNFWATWCLPCVEEMPLLANFAAQHEGRVSVIAVSVDVEGVRAVQPFLDEHPEAPPVALDTAGAVARAMGNIELYPTTLVLDAEGREVERRVGQLQPGELESMVPLPPDV